MRCEGWWKNHVTGEIFDCTESATDEDGWCDECRPVPESIDPDAAYKARFER